MNEYEPEDDSSAVRCPWDGCGYKSETEKGVNIHHKKKHGESIAGVTVHCTWCGGELQRRTKQYDNHFCGDKDCYAEWRSEEFSGENSDWWKGGPVVVSCTWCGDGVERKQHEVEEYDKHFCGDKNCYGEWRSENFAGEGNPSWDGGKVVVQCSWCGDDIERNAFEAKRYDDFFCDRERCKAEWRSEKWSAGNHPNWLGGAVPYGSGFTKAKKEQVRERQNRKCAGCGIVESELPRKLDVHHIRKARFFENDQRRNDKSNLVALCIPCHRRYEDIPLRPQLSD